MSDKKKEHKEYLDKRTKETLLGECDRMAKYYGKYKFEKQAKKLREFKKQVKLLMGTL